MGFEGGSVGFDGALVVFDVGSVGFEGLLDSTAFRQSSNFPEHVLWPSASNDSFLKERCLTSAPFLHLCSPCYDSPIRLYA